MNFGVLFKSSVSLGLLAYSDADYADDTESRRPPGGYIFTAASGPVSWCSQKQPTVALSTTESEYIAGCQAVKELLWLKALLSDLTAPVITPIVIYIDNQSAIKLIKNPEFHKRTKHIDIKFHFIREKYMEKQIDPRYVASSAQLADIFTKPLPKERFRNLREAIGIVDG